jgi:replicative DNA helicase
MSTMRVPPHSRRFEEAMIAAILSSEDAWDLTRGMIGKDDFYVNALAEIYDAAAFVAGPSRAPDTLMVTEALMAKNRPDLVEVMLAATSGHPLADMRAVELAKDLRVLTRRRRVLRAVNELGAAGYDASIDSREYLSSAESAIFAALQDDAVTSGPQRVDPAGAVKRYQQRADAARSGITSGLSSTIPLIDGMTQGFGDGHVWCIAGRPGDGKTVLAQQIASAASAARKAGLVASLEMPKGELEDRAVASVGGVPLTSLRSGLLGQWHWDRIAHAAGEMDQWPLYIDDTPGITLAAFASTVKLMVRRHGIRYAVIDYLQLMRSGARRKGENREQEVAEISKGLKELAKLCNIPIIILSQLNREADGTRPKLSHLRESGAIEQDCDGVILIWRQKNKTTLINAKNRHGPTGDVDVEFDGPTCTFAQSEHQGDSV